MSKPALGFIGLGNMGGPMSTRLVKAGHEVFVYDRDEAALSRAVAAGCKRLESIQAVADQVETVILSLPTPDIVKAVALQDGGLKDGHKVKQVVDLSTIANPDPAELQWRPVGVKGTYLTDEQVLIVNRSQQGRAGSNVVTPMRLEDGRVVLVIRGFIGLDQNPPAPPTGTVRVVGTVRAGEQRRTGQSADSPGELTEFLRLDIDRIAEQTDGEVMPVAVAVEASDPVDDASLTPLTLPELSEGPHLSYAIQWIIFAVAVLVGWVLAVRVSLRRRRTPATPSV